MPNTITYDESSGIYKVYASDIVSIDDILESIEELKKKGIADTLIYVLIDTLRQTSELSILDVETVARVMPGRKHVRSAILTNHSHINIHEQQLLEETASKQGKAIRIFTDKDKALQWLMAKDWAMHERQYPAAIPSYLDSHAPEYTPLPSFFIMAW